MAALKEGESKSRSRSRSRSRSKEEDEVPNEEQMPNEEQRSQPSSSTVMPERTVMPKAPVQKAAPQQKEPQPCSMCGTYMPVSALCQYSQEHYYCLDDKGCRQREEEWFRRLSGDAGEGAEGRWDKAHRDRG